MYPTPPLCAGVSLRNVKFYQDPVLLSVSGIVIGLTATDTVFHIGKYEISEYVWRIYYIFLIQTCIYLFM